MKKKWLEFFCWIRGGHLWVEWERPRVRGEKYFPGTVIRKKPYCIYCPATRSAVISDDLKKYLRKQKQLVKSGKGIRADLI